MEKKRVRLGTAVRVVQLMLMLAALTLGAEEDEDKGFTLFFRSNREEVRDVPIHFRPPLPSWLAGTLVSRRTWLA